MSIMGWFRGRRREKARRRVEAAGGDPDLLVGTLAEGRTAGMVNPYENAMLYRAANSREYEEIRAALRAIDAAYHEITPVTGWGLVSRQSPVADALEWGQKFEAAAKREQA